MSVTPNFPDIFVPTRGESLTSALGFVSIAHLRYSAVGSYGAVRIVVTEDELQLGEDRVPFMRPECPSFPCCYATISPRGVV